MVRLPINITNNTTAAAAACFGDSDLNANVCESLNNGISINNAFKTDNSNWKSITS